MYYFLHSVSLFAEDEIEEDLNNQLEYPIEPDKRPRQIPEFYSHFTFTNHKEVTCSAMSSNGQFLLLGSAVC